MPYDTLAVERFGGMRLDMDVMELGAAFAEDARDVRLREDGRIMPRDIETQIYTGLPSVSTFAAKAIAFNGRLVVAGSGTGGRFVAINSSTGAVTHTQLAAAGVGNAGITAFGQSSTLDELYMVMGGITTMYRYTDAAGFVAVAFPASVNPNFINTIAYLPESNRLVIAEGSGGTNKVHFYDPISATAMDADSFVSLQPGVDLIAQMLVFERQLVVVKKRQLFFFAAPSTDSFGEAVFDYRVLELGGIGINGVKAVVGRKGIYLAAAGKGVYVTRGGAPELISGPIQPIFDGVEAGRRIGPIALITSIGGMAAHDDQILIGFSGTDGTVGVSGTLVYDERSGEWSYDSYQLIAGASTTVHGLGFLQASGGGFTNVTRLWSGNVGSAPNARYRSGFYEPRQGAQVALRRSVLEGVGTVTLKQGQDGGALDAGDALVLGTTAAPDRAWRQKATRGRRHQFELSGTGDWSVHRLEHHVGRARRPSTET